MMQMLQGMMGGGAWGGGGGGGDKMKKGPKGGAVCSVHFKERSGQSLQDDGMGGMCCKPGMECQVGANDKNLRDMYCSTHKKKRSASSLMDDGMGGKCCAPGFECQISTMSDAERE